LKLIGGSTLAATRTDSSTTLHIHADRALILRDCSDTPCKTTRLAKGDSELAIAVAGELEILAGKTKIVVHFQPLEARRATRRPQRRSDRTRLRLAQHVLGARSTAGGSRARRERLFEWGDRGSVTPLQRHVAPSRALAPHCERCWAHELIGRRRCVGAIAVQAATDRYH